MPAVLLNDMVSVFSVGALPGPPVLLLNTVTIRPPLLGSFVRPGVNTVLEKTYGPATLYPSSFINSEPEKVAPPSTEYRMMMAFGLTFPGVAFPVSTTCVL